MGGAMVPARIVILAAGLAAATLWTQILFEQGAISVKDYLGQAKARHRRPPRRPELLGTAAGLGAGTAKNSCGIAGVAEARGAISHGRPAAPRPALWLPGPSIKRRIERR